MRVVIDTNVIIDHFRGVEAATRQMEEIEAGNFEGLISTITIMELMAARRMTESRKEAIQSILGIFTTVAVDKGVASKAGELLSKYRLSHGLDPIDALIAATALNNDAVLFTLNKKHFRYIEGLVSINSYVVDND